MCCGPHVKPVGERNAGNPHVAFDAREEETECKLQHEAQATAPLLDSTIATANLLTYIAIDPELTKSHAEKPLVGNVRL